MDYSFTDAPENLLRAHDRLMADGFPQASLLLGRNSMLGSGSETEVRRDRSAAEVSADVALA
jgi:hypothetical protein